MSRYKFTSIHKDPQIMRIQKEIEDNLAKESDLNDKLDKVSFTNSVPKMTDLSDGELKVYVNGATKRLYIRSSSRLFHVNLTEAT